MDRNVSLYDGLDVSSTKLSVKSGCVQNPDAKGCHGDETLYPQTPKILARSRETNIGIPPGLQLTFIMLFITYLPL